MLGNGSKYVLAAVRMAAVVMSLEGMALQEANQHDQEFLSWPGLIRVTPGETASLNWTVDITVGDEPGRIYRGTDPAGDCILTYAFSKPSYDGCLPGYEDRIQFIYGGSTIGISLPDITAADAGDYYGCQHAFPQSGYRENSNATIYVYSPLGPPYITGLQQPTPEGDTLPVTCVSYSQTSMPPFYRETLAYIWLRDGVTVNTGNPDRHIVSEGSLSVSPVVREDVYSCIAQDGGLNSPECPEVRLPVGCE